MSLLQDVRQSLRRIGRRPGTFVLSLILLTLGIGANTATFSVINAVLLRPLPYPDPEALALAFTSFAEMGGGEEAVSYLNYLDWKARSDVFEGLAAFTSARSVTATGDHPPVGVSAELVSANYYQVFGVEPLLGRGFDAEEQDERGARVAVVSRRLWLSLLGSDPGVVGRTLRLDGEPFEVIGVLPDHFRGAQWDPVDVWLPLGAASTLLGDRYLDDRGFSWLICLGRLKPGVGLDQAREALRPVAEELEADFPIINRGARIMLMGLADFYYAETLRRQLRFLVGAALFLLLACCATVGGLILAEALARRKEIALRTALGASRLRLARLFVSHSLLISLPGALIAAGLAPILARSLVRLSDVRPATFVEDYLDVRVLMITATMAVFAAIVVGLIPAVLISSSGLHEALKEGGRTPAVRGSSREKLRSALVVGQIAVAFVLVFGTGLMARSFFWLSRTGPGSNLDQWLAVKVNLPSSRYDEEGTGRLAELVASEVETLPGVQAVTVVGPDLAPFATIMLSLISEEQLGDPKEQIGLSVHRHSVLPGYFRSLGVPLLRGRDFSRLDDDDQDPVAIVSSSVAEVLWPGEDPIGRRMKLDPAITGDVWVVVVGVAADVGHRGNLGRDKGDLDVYFPFAQVPERGFYLQLKMESDPDRLASSLRSRIQLFDPDLSIDRIESMEDRFELAAADQRFTLVLTGIFSFVALWVAVASTYGVMSVDVDHRLHEIGIRLAVGARRREVVGLVLRKAARLVVPGLLLGIVGCVALQRVLSSLIHGISPADPLTLAAVIVSTSVAAFVAVVAPSRRVAKLDPVTVLRQE